jgi:hypothetical protein
VPPKKAKKRTATRKRVTKEAQRVRELEARLAELEGRQPQGPAADPAVAQGWERLPDEPAPDPYGGFRPAPEPAPEAPPEPTPAQEPSTSRSVIDIERYLGANWLAKAGMLVLVLGVVFFFKYAIDAGWLSRPLQIVLGIVLGVGLVFLGDLLLVRKRYGVYPQVLSAGGAIIAYFVLFASYAFPAYRAATGMTLEVAAVLLGVAAIGFGAYALWRETPVLAGVGVALGAATSIVAESWTPFSVFYLVVLTVAVALVSAHRRWESGLFVALGVSLATLVVNQALGMPADLAAWTGACLAAFILLLGAWRASEPVALTAALAGGVLVFSEAYARADATALAILGTGLAAMALVAAAWRTWMPLFVLSLLAGYGLLAHALAHGAQPWVGLGLAGAILLVHVAVHFRPGEPPAPHAGWHPLSVLAGASLVAAWAVALFALTLARLDDARGPTTIGLALAAIGLGLLAPAQRAARVGWVAAGVALALAWPPIQFDGPATTYAWTALLALSVLGVQARRDPVLRGAVLVGALLLTGHLYIFEAVDLWRGRLDPIAGLFPFLTATLALLGAAWVESKQPRLAQEFDAALVLLGLALATPLVYMTVALDGYFISIAWAAEALLLVGAGYMFGVRNLRLAGLGLFGLVLLRVFIYDIAQLDPLVRIVTFLAVGAIILAASFLFARRGEAPEAPAAPPR